MYGLCMLIEINQNMHRVYTCDQRFMSVCTSDSLKKKSTACVSHILIFNIYLPPFHFKTNPGYVVFLQQYGSAEMRIKADPTSTCIKAH